MYISKRNMRGSLALFVLCLLIVIAPRIISELKGESKYTFSTEELAEVRKEVTRLHRESSPEVKKRVQKKYSVPKSKFNPNDYSVEDWVSLGLSDKQAAVVIKFAAHGIDNNDELKKVFVIPDELFLLIKDSTFYPNRVVTTYNEKSHFAEKRTVKMVDLNNCTVDDLIQLPGIGEYFANKILEYNQRLGGFVSNEQLLEVWRFDMEKLEKIEPYLLNPSEKIAKININSATIEELKVHPYFDWKKANSIVKMREQHGAYKSFSDLEKSKLIDKEWIDKIKPYINLN